MLTISDPRSLDAGQCGTTDGRRVFFRCDHGNLYYAGRIYAVGQTVDDVRIPDCADMCAAEARRLMGCE